MGSMAPGFKNMMGQNLGIKSNSPPPVVQQQPQAQQPQAPQQSPMRGMLQMLMNQMMGIKAKPSRPVVQRQTSSPRDALIQTLMGGGYGR